jgi:mRNA-degrading endonuclease RelE of RelBE toxin-antitoxin system
VRATVIATTRYEKEARRLLSEDERDAMQKAIAAGPEAHPVVPATGGVRKARWGRQGKGKSGGVRVIYYYLVSDTEVYMLSVYSKNEQSNMTEADRKAAKGFVEALKNAKKESR